MGSDPLNGNFVCPNLASKTSVHLYAKIPINIYRVYIIQCVITDTI